MTTDLKEVDAAPASGEETLEHCHVVVGPARDTESMPPLSSPAVWLRPHNPSEFDKCVFPIKCITLCSSLLATTI